MRGYTLYGPKWGQNNHLYKTKRGADNALKKHLDENKKSDRQVVVVADNDLMFYDKKCTDPVWRVGFYRKATEEFREAVKDDGGKYQTVREALDEKRKQLKGKVTALILCKRELFYHPSPGLSTGNTVYPVSMETATAEAEFFGCTIQEG